MSAVHSWTFCCIPFESACTCLTPHSWRSTRLSSCRRSEERRVGKECRSLCDWSSDVCSSDLDERGAQLDFLLHTLRERLYLLDAPLLEIDALEQLQEIGRASCRERV